MLVINSTGETYLPEAQYPLAAPIVMADAIAVRGDKSGAGPGTVAWNKASTIGLQYPSGHGIEVGPTLYGSRFEHLQFNNFTPNPRTSGAAIKLHATGLSSTCSGFLFNDVAFSGQYRGIELRQCSVGVITGTYHQAWVDAAIYATGNGVNEGSTGFLDKNWFFGDTEPGTPQTFGCYLKNGYARFINNHFLGSKLSVFLDVSEFPAGGFEVKSNWFEEHDVAGVYVTNSYSPFTAALLAINDNEFSNATYPTASRANFQGHIVVAGGPDVWLSLLQINGNRMRSCVQPSAAYASFIYARNCARGQITGNSLEGLSGNTCRGVTVDTGAQQIDVLDNLVYGSFSTKYVLTNECNFRDFGSRLTAAELNAIVCRNGSQAWCEDGIIGSSPLAGGGTGCIARRESGIWKG